eukprot:g13961.t1
MSLGKYLFGRPTYAIWLHYMNKWEDDRKPLTISGSRSSSGGHNNRWWWSEFGAVAAALGLTATAVAAALMGGLAFPAVAVGPVIWTVLRSWHGSFETKIKQSPNKERLLDVFGHLAKSVGSTIDQLNTKIKDAEENSSIDPKGAAAEIANQKIRVVLLQTCLDREVARMEDTAACDEDDMMARIGGLFHFQRKLQKDLDQRRVSDDLQRVVSALERVEGLLCDVFRAQSTGGLPGANGGTPKLTPWISGITRTSSTRTTRRMAMVAVIRVVALVAGMGGIVTTSLSLLSLVCGRSALNKVAVTVGYDLSELVTATSQKFGRLRATKAYDDNLMLGAPAYSDGLLSLASESGTGLQQASSRRAWTTGDAHLPFLTGPPPEPPSRSTGIDGPGMSAIWTKKKRPRKAATAQTTPGVGGWRRSAYAGRSSSANLDVPPGIEQNLDVGQNGQSVDVVEFASRKFTRADTATVVPIAAVASVSFAATSSDADDDTTPDSVGLAIWPGPEHRRQTVLQEEHRSGRLPILGDNTGRGQPWLSDGIIPRENTCMQVYDELDWFRTNASRAEDPTKLEFPLGSASLASMVEWVGKVSFEAASPCPGAWRRDGLESLLQSRTLSKSAALVVDFRHEHHHRLLGYFVPELDDPEQQVLPELDTTSVNVEDDGKGVTVTTSIAPQTLPLRVESKTTIIAADPTVRGPSTLTTPVYAAAAAAAYGSLGTPATIIAPVDLRFGSECCSTNVVLSSSEEQSIFTDIGTLFDADTDQPLALVCGGSGPCSAGPGSPISSSPAGDEMEGKEEGHEEDNEEYEDELEHKGIKEDKKRQRAEREVRKERDGGERKAEIEKEEDKVDVHPQHPNTSAALDHVFDETAGVVPAEMAGARAAPAATTPIFRGTTFVALLLICFFVGFCMFKLRGNRSRWLREMLWTIVTWLNRRRSIAVAWSRQTSMAFIEWLGGTQPTVMMMRWLTFAAGIARGPFAVITMVSFLVIFIRGYFAVKLLMCLLLLAWWHQSVAAWVMQRATAAFPAAVLQQRGLPENQDQRMDTGDADRAQGDAPVTEAPAPSVGATTSNAADILYSPLGSLFTPALSKDSLISISGAALDGHQEATREFSRLVEAIRLDRVDEGSFSWLISVWNSAQGLKILKGRRVRYKGPPSLRRIGGSPGSLSSRANRGITPLIKLVFTGRVLADPRNVPHEYAVIFGEGWEFAGRPAVEGDEINGAGARVLTVSEWVGVYGEWVGSWLRIWAYPQVQVN